MNPEPLPFVYCITKYDPADRDEDGYYHGPEDIVSDHGPQEAAYLAAMTAFATESEITQLAIREPSVTGFVHFEAEPPIPGHGLAGLFPPDLTGYHDGAMVDLSTAAELVRAMLRGNGAWCRLEVDDRFLVHIGYDQCMYVGSMRDCPEAVARTHELGLFAVPVSFSPWEFDEDDLPPNASRRPADDRFWAEVEEAVAACGSLLLEEWGNASRYHRLVPGAITPVRQALTPRSVLHLWPDLDEITAIIGALLSLGDLVKVVYELPDGRLEAAIVDRAEETVPPVLTAATAASLHTMYEDDADQPATPYLRVEPLLKAVLPDADGVLRARWAA